MKIKRIYFLTSIQSLGHASSVSAPKDKIAFVAEINGFLINDTVLVPSSNVKEVILEAEPVNKVNSKVTNLAEKVNSKVKDAA